MEDGLDSNEVWELLEALGVMRWNENVHRNGDLEAEITVLNTSVEKTAIKHIEAVFRMDYSIVSKDSGDGNYAIIVTIEEGKKEME